MVTAAGAGAPAFTPTPPAVGMAPGTWAKLRLGVNVSAVSDILHARGLHQQVMRHDMQALDPAMRICGLARTVSSQPRVGTPEPGLEYELLFAAIDGLRLGEVLVTDRADCCVWGELCAEAAMRRGGNGAVIDGFTRDSAEIRSLGFPLFCRGRHMSDLLYHRTIIALNQPVLCGDVRVHPGDLILGAEDGILAVPQTQIDDVVREAYEKSLTESKARVALRDGMSAGEAYRRFGVM
jgi:4-hydroxy-4-methyl-2-oxoglutarate aldolase